VRAHFAVEATAILIEELRQGRPVILVDDNDRETSSWRRST